MQSMSAKTAEDVDGGAFGRERRRLFGIAYRMLGSVAEAEDVVQDAWLRWQGTDQSAVLDPTAFLVTTTTRLAINVLQSARARRETYVGPWLPEPVDTSADPHLGAERGEALQLAVLLLLETLSPTERAAYVLREAFDYAHAEIAAILGLGEANVRQLVTRARQHIADERRAPSPEAEQRRFLEAFLAAARRGDRAALEGLFVSDVASYTDGNGTIRAARKPVFGRAFVAKFVAGFAAVFWKDATPSLVEANGQPGVLVSRGGIPYGFITIEASAEGIAQIQWIVSLPKLAGLRRQAPASPSA